MKVILTGATGFLGAEVLKQALVHPSITSIISLGRRHTPLPQNTTPVQAAKLKSAVCEDFTKYSQDVKNNCEGASACIWVQGLTHTKADALPVPKRREIILDYPAHFIKTSPQFRDEGATKPFKFIYTSTAIAERDPNNKPWIMGDNCVLRGEVENLIIKLGKESAGKVTTTVAKPGLIDQLGRFGFVINVGRSALCWFISLPRVDVREVSAALIEKAVAGGDGRDETLLNADLVRIGREVLGREKS